MGLAPTGAGHRLGAGRARHQSGGRQHHPARVVGDGQRHRGGAGHERHRLRGATGPLRTPTRGGGVIRSRSGRRRHALTGGLQQHRAPRGAELLGHGRQLTGDHTPQQHVVGQDRLEGLDLAGQLVALLLQLDDRELREPAQLELKDVAGLRLGEVEDLHEPGARRGGVVGGADDGDDLIDVEDGDEQAVHQVGALATLAQAEPGAPGDHREAVAHEHLQQLAQPQGVGLTVHEGDVVDAEGVLQRRVLVELGQDRLGVVAVLDADDQAGAVLAVGEVGDVGDALELLGAHRLLDAGDDLLRSHHVGQLGDHDALAARGDGLHVSGGPCEELAAPRAVGLPDPVQAHDHAAGGQVRPRHEGHELLQSRLRVSQQVPGGGHHLHQVVRRHVRGHTHRDARRAIDQQVREGRRQHLGLGERVVVVGGEVDRVLIQVRRQRQGRGGQARLGVAGGRRPIVQRAEVAVTVNERQAHREGLGQAHKRLIDRGVPMRVEPPHDIAHDPGGLHVRTIRAQPHPIHLEQDAALNRLEPVAGVRQGARVDDGVGVLQEAGAHLRGQVEIDDLPVGRGRSPGGGRLRHGRILRGIGPKTNHDTRA